MTDHFTVLGLEERYALDPDALRSRYLERTRATHPDRAAHQSYAEQAAALRDSSAVNEAFRVLRDPVLRLHYLLQRYGLLTEAGDATAGAELSPEFLLEMMDFNEALDELPEGTESEHAEQLAAEIRTKLAEREAQMVAAGHAFDSAADKAEALRPAVQAYLERQYLLRLAQRVGSFAHP